MPKTPEPPEPEKEPRQEPWGPPGSVYVGKIGSRLTEIQLDANGYLEVESIVGEPQGVLGFGFKSKRRRRA